MLPFKTQPTDEKATLGNPQLGEIEVPKYFSVTANEELEIIPVLQVADFKKPDGLLYTETALARILLKRVKPDLSKEDVAALPVPIVKACAEFLLSERNGWKKQERNDDGGKLTGETMSEPPAKSSPNSTGDSAPAGPITSTETPLEAKPSRKSAKPPAKTSD